MNSQRIVASITLTVGSFLFSAMITVIIGLVSGAEAEITAVSEGLWLVAQPNVLIVLLGGIALALWGLTIYSWLSPAMPREI